MAETEQGHLPQLCPGPSPRSPSPWSNRPLSLPLGAPVAPSICTPATQINHTCHSPLPIGICSGPSVFLGGPPPLLLTSLPSCTSPARGLGSVLRARPYQPQALCLLHIPECQPLLCPTGMVTVIVPGWDCKEKGVVSRKT